MAARKVLASGGQPRPPPRFNANDTANSSMVFDPPLPKPKVLADGHRPQPPAPWTPVEGVEFDPPLKIKCLSNGLMPQPPPKFDPHDNPGIDFDPPVQYMPDDDEELDLQEEADLHEHASDGDHDEGTIPPAAPMAAEAAPATTGGAAKYRIKKKNR
jgi:hypothetical protein